PAGTGIDCYVTTAKGWFKVPDAQVTIVQQKNSANNQCSAVNFTLLGNDPATANYSAALHGGTFKSALPIVKVYLKNIDTAAYPYDDLKDNVLKSVEINVSVGGNDISYNQNGLKQLMISGDSGPLDASKPFQPFGPMPKAGASFVIGSQELFTKKGAAVLLNIEWANMPSDSSKIGYPASNYLPAAHVEFLSNGKWIKDSDSNVYIFSWGSSSNPVLTTAYERFSLDDGTIINYDDPYDAYNAKTNQGFLKITLDTDLGFDTYQADQIGYLIKLANNTWPASGTVPFKPYSPAIKSIYISYNAITNFSISDTAQNTFDERTIQYYHLYPFGEAEQGK